MPNVKRFRFWIFARLDLSLSFITHTVCKCHNIIYGFANVIRFKILNICYTRSSLIDIFSLHIHLEDITILLTRIPNVIRMRSRWAMIIYWHAEHTNKISSCHNNRDEKCRISYRLRTKVLETRKSLLWWHNAIMQIPLKFCLGFRECLTSQCCLQWIKFYTIHWYEFMA